MDRRTQRSQPLAGDGAAKKKTTTRTGSSKTRGRDAAPLVTTAMDGTDRARPRSKKAGRKQFCFLVGRTEEGIAGHSRIAGSGFMRRRPTPLPRGRRKVLPAAVVSDSGHRGAEKKLAGARSGLD